MSTITITVSFVRPFVCSFVCSFVRSFVRSFVCSFLAYCQSVVATSPPSSFVIITPSRLSTSHLLLYLPTSQNRSHHRSRDSSILSLAKPIRHFRHCLVEVSAADTVTHCDGKYAELEHMKDSLTLPNIDSLSRVAVVAPV